MKELAKIKDAEIIAKRAHDEQLYGIWPYHHHLKDVVSKVNWLVTGKISSLVQYKCNQVAWLHDSLEDTVVSEGELRVLFSSDVVDAIVLVTKEDGYDYDEYIERIKDNFIALTVKLADTIANLSFSMSNGCERRIKKYTRQYELLNPKFREMLEAINKAGGTL